MSKPLSVDEELKQHCDSLGVPSLWYDRLIEIVLTDRKKHELQARIDELENNKWLPNEAKWIEQEADRIAELKQELEKL